MIWLELEVTFITLGLYVLIPFTVLSPIIFILAYGKLRFHERDGGVRASRTWAKTSQPGDFYGWP